MRPHVRSQQLDAAHRAALLMGAVLLNIPAYASPPPRCADSATCAELANKARSLSSEGKSEEALKLYQAAYQVHSDPRLLYNTGRILHRTGHPSEAASYYQRVLDSGINEGDMRQKAAEYLRQAQAEQAQATKPINTSVLTITPPTSLASTVPVYKRPWFWVVIGTAGAALVAGVVAGIVIHTTPPSGTLPFKQNQ